MTTVHVKGLCLLFQNHYALFGNGTEPIVELGAQALIMSLFATGLAIGVCLSVGFLFYIQVL